MRARFVVTILAAAWITFSTGIGTTPPVFAAENSGLKAEISRSLDGTVLVSKMTLGDRAVATDPRVDWPVITIANIATGEITYRIESGFIRLNVGQRQMRRRFEPGTKFHVSSVDLKDDRLELKLESESGGSAKLRLVFSNGWQSNSTVNTVVAQLTTVFIMPTAPAASSATASITNSTPQQATGTSQSAPPARLSAFQALDVVGGLSGSLDRQTEDLFVSALEKSQQCEQTQDAQSCQDAAEAARKALAAPKSTQVSDLNWARWTTFTYPVFRAAVARIGARVQLPCQFSPNSPLKEGDISVCVEGGPVFELAYANCWAPYACVGILYNIGEAYFTGGKPPLQICDRCNENPASVPEDKHQALLWFQWAAELGQKEAQFRIAKMYFSGTGVPRDEARGMAWFEKAVADTTVTNRLLNGESCYYGTWEHENCDVGVLGYTPDSGHKDLNSAFMWFTAAAEEGSTKAMYYLGAIYESGGSVPQSYSRAFDWYTKSAQGGDVDGETSLGLLYYTGRGVAQDYGKAFEWLGKAADQNSAKAQMELGDMYEHGRGVPTDYRKAAEWYSRAAQQANPDAQLALGTMYEHGRGVQQDYVTAFDWYQEASKNGRAEGAARAASLQPKVDAIEQAKAVGYNPGENLYGSPAVEVSAIVLNSRPITVSDVPGHLLLRDLISLREDFPHSDHKEWFEIICTETVLAEQKSPIDDPSKPSCTFLTPGKTYRFVASEYGNTFELHLNHSKYPVSVYQIWNRCTTATNNCVSYTRGPIHAIRRPNGNVER